MSGGLEHVGVIAARVVEKLKRASEASIASDALITGTATVVAERQPAPPVPPAGPGGRRNHGRLGSRVKARLREALRHVCFKLMGIGEPRRSLLREIVAYESRARD